MKIIDGVHLSVRRRKGECRRKFLFHVKGNSLSSSLFVFAPSKANIAVVKGNSSNENLSMHHAAETAESMRDRKKGKPLLSPP
jgi:hypothetical protein